MINTKELRIGNLVNHKTRGTVEVLEVYTGIINIAAPELNMKQIATQASRFEYIPLTEEWLGKLGFELNEDEGDIKYFQLGKYGVKSEEEMDFYFYKGEDVISTLAEIKWVHQLQNLYYALSKEELKISNDVSAQNN